MTTSRRKSADVVVVGVGVAGSILAKELADAGLKVVGLERGPHRDASDFPMPHTHDELRYARRHELMQDLSRETITFRNASSETALPMREFGSFVMGEGLGGAGLHWDGMTWRFLPWDFESRSRSVARYGASIFPADCTSQDWGITYDELEPSLRPVRAGLRGRRQSGKPEWRDPARRESLRGAARARVPQSPNEDRPRWCAVCPSRTFARL